MCDGVKVTMDTWPTSGNVCGYRSDLLTVGAFDHISRTSWGLEDVRLLQKFADSQQYRIIRWGTSEMHGKYTLIHWVDLQPLPRIQLLLLLLCGLHRQHEGSQRPIAPQGICLCTCVLGSVGEGFVIPSAPRKAVDWIGRCHRSSGVNTPAQALSAASGGQPEKIWATVTEEAPKHLHASGLRRWS